MQTEKDTDLNNKRFNLVIFVIAIALVLFDRNVLEAMAWGSDDVFFFLVPPLILFFLLIKWFSFLRPRLSQTGSFFSILISTALVVVALLALPGGRHLFDLGQSWFYEETILETALRAVLIAFFVGINGIFPFDKKIERLAKITCLILVCLSSFFSTLTVRTANTYVGVMYRESVSISTLSDQYLYSPSGNPVGILMEYLITSKKDITDYSSIDLASPHGFKLNADPAKYDNDQSPLIIFDARIDPEPSNQVLLKNQAYRVTLYAVPEYIQDKALGYREVGNLRIVDGKVVNLGSVCINEEQREVLMNENEIGFYSTEFRLWRPATHNSYSPLNLYQGYVKEGVSSCVNTGT